MACIWINSGPYKDGAEIMTNVMNIYVWDYRDYLPSTTSIYR